MLIHQSSQFQGQLRPFFNFNKFMEEPSTRAPSRPQPMISKLQAPTTAPSIIIGLDEDQEGVTAIDVDMMEGRVVVEPTRAPSLGRRRRLRRKHLVQMARERLQLMSEGFIH